MARSKVSQHYKRNDPKISVNIPYFHFAFLVEEHRRMCVLLQSSVRFRIQLLIIKFRMWFRLALDQRFFFPDLAEPVSGFSSKNARDEINSTAQYIKSVHIFKFKLSECRSYGCVDFCILIRSVGLHVCMFTVNIPPNLLATSDMWETDKFRNTASPSI